MAKIDSAEEKFGPDVFRLLASIDAEPWLSMRALADALEEEGEVSLALGMRLLVNGKRYPIYWHEAKSGHVKYPAHWLWCDLPSSFAQSTLTNWLPEELFHPGRLTRGNNYPTATSALLAAAKVAGQVYRNSGMHACKGDVWARMVGSREGNLGEYQEPALPAPG